MQWTYGSNAITVEVKPDPNLNLFGGQPHTLALGVYQTADPNAFISLLNDPAAIGKLFATGYASAGTLGFTRYIIEPGKPKTITVDRAQNAKYVGIVAGYFKLDPPNTARLFQIPVVVKTSGWIIHTRVASPGNVVINLLLGTEQLVNALRVRQPEEGKPKEGEPEAETGQINLLTPAEGGK
ncbi:MAG: type VI secretion lipoprotein TssJ [Nitrospirota bacterium]|nr:type VI secretion lipoprotein TssJ [Nitrospirota bacterium]